MKLIVTSDGKRYSSHVVDESGAQRPIYGLSLEMLEHGGVGMFLEVLPSIDMLKDITEIEVHFTGPIFITPRRKADPDDQARVLHIRDEPRITSAEERAEA